MPNGTVAVTFLFTDIEGSTRLWEQQPEAMSAALAYHDALLRRVIKSHGGRVFKTVGDACFAAFPAPIPALQAALQAQRALYSSDWGWLGLDEPIRVRMALHTGMAEARDSDYFGPPLNRVARLLSAGHGGQVLMSQATHDRIKGANDAHLPDVEIRDMGERRLKDLTRPEHIFQVIVPDLPSQFPPLKTLDYRANNLPRQPTALIGREGEVREVAALLRRRDVLLVTLTGPGGVGKTRLGLQVAADQLDEFADGVWFVELAALAHHNLVLSTIAQTLGVGEAAGSALLDTMKEYLHDKRMLVVLDNFEQVMDAAPEVSTLLKVSPGLKVLVTSRAALRIRGEKEYAVPPLSLPDLNHLPIDGQELASLLSRYDAVRLFSERAQDIKPDFRLTPQNAAAIAGICIHLDGLPLAIELAAARIRIFSPSGLLAGLGSRFELLTGGARDSPARQQTLRATMEWSYDLLTEGEKQLFRRMAVFNGGRTIEALKAVCNADGELQIEVPEGVEALARESLLSVREGSQQREEAAPSETEGEPRFWMYELIHEFARDLLEESGEGPALRWAHARYFLHLAQEAGPRLRAADQGRWLSLLDDEYDNMRAVLNWAAESEEQEAAALGADVAWSLRVYWYVRSFYTEARDQYKALLASIERVTRANQSQAAKLNLPLKKARILLRAGSIDWTLGELEEACSLLQMSLDIFRQLGDKEGIGMALLNLGNVALYQSDYPAARALYEESLVVHREVGDSMNIAGSLHNVGVVAETMQDYPAAQKALQEALAIRRQLGDKVGIAQILQNLADVTISLGDLADGAAMYAESLSIYWEAGYRWGMVEALENLARVAGARAAEAEKAEETEEIEGIEEVEGTGPATGGLTVLGLHRKATGSRRELLLRAVRLWAAGFALRKAIGTPVPPSQVEEYERAIAYVKSGLEPEDCLSEWEEGAGMPLEDVVVFALEGCKQGAEQVDSGGVSKGGASS
jgi:predicted ATPase/class 3 adenylate cyclase